MSRQQQGGTITAYTGSTLIENNVCFNNGGRGIHIFRADNVVSLADFSLLSSSINLTMGSSGYSANADLNGDGSGTLIDFAILASNFNTSGS
jgi:hypothetical protein